MLDFAAFRSGKVSIAELAEDVTYSDLRELTDEMVKAMLTVLFEATNEVLRFVPTDPQATDSDHKMTEEKWGWTLARVVAHTTASAEEATAQALTLARGVTVTGRSRSEVPWQTLNTVEQLRARLKESYRMR